MISLSFKDVDGDSYADQEAGAGYADILLVSPGDKAGCVIELKYAENGDFENNCKKAIQQID